VLLFGVKYIGCDIIKIPLISETFIDDEGNQKLSIWKNKEKIIIDGPFNPYFMAKKQLEFSGSDDRYHRRKGKSAAPVRSQVT
jgi:hypothetical protein